ncbi:MAG: fibronectin type III domain-containing protein [Chryseobacterium sp.]|nr:fibronectin type III domain-containing protein [Candidatus Chryseobacterium enterohippi]
MGLIPLLHAQAASPLPYYQNFDVNNDFTLNNGTQTNKWNYGNATGNTGKSIYISDDAGVTNGYTISTTSVVQAYKDFIVPAGTLATTPATLSYDFKSYGESCCDYLRVWLAPTTFTPTAGTQTAAGTGRVQLGANINLVASWQSYLNTNLNLAAYAGTTVRLIFEWRNDGSVGTNPSAAIDNVNLLIPTCTAPTNPTVTATSITTTGATLTWGAIAPAPGVGYEYYISTNPNAPTPTTAPTGLTTTNSVTLNNLTPNTTYYYWVRAKCSATDNSIWVAAPNSFLTNQIPATIPYSQDFTAGNDFGFISGTQANKWAHGNATGNGGNSIYISEDYGVTNTYNITSTTIAHAFREFIVPNTVTATTPALLTFNWKAQGQTTLDYMKVWVVPASYTPTAGTAISALAGSRVQIGTLFNLNSTWQFYTNAAVNLAPYAGSNVRLVFEWTNNNTTGTAPAAAVDNVNLVIPTCKIPTAMSANPIAATTATIGWTAPSPAPANGYQYYLSTSSVPPTATTAPTGTTTTTSVPLTGLTPNTTYYWWIRSVCSTSDSSIWVFGTTFTTTQIPATLPYTQNFNTNNDFGFSTGTQINRWAYGNATGNAGNSIYISNDGGLTNTYNITTTSVVHAYRDITVPAGVTAASPAILSFDWKAEGQTTLDYMRVWLVPATFNPTAGTNITALANSRIQIGTYFNQNGTWQSYLNTAVNLTPYAGTTMRLVFEWVNNNATGTQPPAAVDNVNLQIPTCKVPTNLAAGTINAVNATFTWTAPSPAPANGYQYYVSTSPVPPTTTATGSTTATTVVANGLLPNTTYYWWVRAICSTSDSSIWVPGPTFTTTQIPANIPYVQPFNTNDFGFTNGTQVNKWAYGAATGNTGNSIYISNDNGVSNDYTATTLSVVQAYRDIAIPAGATSASLSFDWKAQGESCCDYLRVWLVPATFTPVAGSQITAATGRQQLGGNMNLQTAWQNYNNQNLNLAPFAGTTMRLVFEWRNDGSVGTNPSAAVDNINLLVCNNAKPTVTVNAVTHNSAVVTWNQDQNGATYIVNYRPLGTTTWTTINVAAMPFGTVNNTITLTGLIPFTPYEVEVAAVCKTSVGVYAHNEFTTRCDPTPPNIVISSVTTNSAVVTWGPLAGNASYYMEYREVGSATWTAIAPTPQPPLNTVTLTGLGSYKTYEVRIANKCNGETTQNPWSNPQVFTTIRTCDIAPPGLTITQLTTTTAEVTWEPYTGVGATNNYVLRYRKVGIPSWTTIPVATNTYTITGLIELTKYEMQVANICSGTPGNFTPLYYFITPTIRYCQMSSTNFASEFISKVTVEPTGQPTMTNTSLGSNYTDYTSIVANFVYAVQGSTGNKITINKTVTGTEGTGVAVWIDFNRNGYFDIDERILADGPNMKTSVTGTFSIPSNAYVSNTDFQYLVMRVALMKGDIPVNCMNFDNGEVEDYTVRISKQPIANAIDITEIVIYPNPVKSVLNVKNISKKANYKIYTAAGQVVSTGLIVNNKIDVSRLINGVYMIDIEDEKGTAQKKFIKE